MASREELVSKRALEQGIITPVQLSEAMSATRGGEFGDVLDALIAKGHLARDQVAELSPDTEEAGVGSPDDAPREADAPSAGEDDSAEAPPARKPSERKKLPGIPDDMRVIAGYEVLGTIGRGAMGAVYRARKADTGDIVAVKVLPPSAATKQFVARFKRESEIVKRLDHRNIVKCHDFGYDEESRCHFCALELVEGENLRAMVSRLGTIPEREVIIIARQLAHALNHAFGEGLVHRDVKPANVMIMRGGVVKLLDLGLARPVEVEGPGLTMAGMFVGSPYYASPEQARADPNVDFRSDMYSLGATIYHMVSGEPPFKGQGVTEVLISQLDEQIPWPEGKDVELSSRLGLIAAKMMAKDPANRYLTPKEMSLDLDIVWQGSEPVIAARGPALSTIALPGWPKAPKRKRKRQGIRVKTSADARRKSSPSLPGAANDETGAAGLWMGLTGPQLGLAGAATALLLLVVALAIAFSGGEHGETSGGNAEPETFEVSGEPSSSPKPAAGAPPARESVAGRALEALKAAKQYARKKPGDFPGIASRYGKASLAARGTAFEFSADEALARIHKTWRAAGRKAFESAKVRSDIFLREGAYDDAIAVWNGIPRELAPKIRKETAAEKGAVRRIAEAKIDKAIRSAEALLAEGDTPGVRAALRSIEDVRYELGKDSVAPRVVSLLTKAAEADRQAARARAGREEMKLAALCDEFVGLALAGDYTPAKERMLAAAGDPANDAIADKLLSAARVAKELVGRRAAMIAGAEERVGKPMSLKIGKEVRRGTLREAGEAGLVVVRQNIINGEVQSENRYEIAWNELDPTTADAFASGWRPTGADGETAKALVALERKDTKAAAAALASAGDHPLARHVKAKLAPLVGGPKAPRVRSTPGKAWPPTREQVAACFRGKLVSYDPEGLAAEVLYEFSNPEEEKDWKLAGPGRKQGDRLVVRSGRLFVSGEQVWALAPGIFTTVAAKADFALIGNSSTDAALAVMTEGLRGACNFYGLEGGRFTCLEKRAGAKAEKLGRSIPSPFARRRRGRIGLACGNQRLAGYIGSKSVAGARDASIASVQVGVFTRRSMASFDNITVSGNLDEKWLRRAVPSGAAGPRPEIPPPDATAFAGHFYKLFRPEKALSWHEAQRFCEERGGHLVTITSPGEQFFAAQLARRSEMKAVWIGLTNEGHAGEWKWVTGEPLEFQGWAKGEPNDWGGRGEHWSILYGLQQFAWNDELAKMTQVGFICEW